MKTFIHAKAPNTHGCVVHAKAPNTHGCVVHTKAPNTHGCVVHAKAPNTHGCVVHHNHNGGNNPRVHQQTHKTWSFRIVLYNSATGKDAPH
ncbi:hypothetical protein H8958_011842 [Nasalis larvatus]